MPVTPLMPPKGTKQQLLITTTPPQTRKQSTARGNTAKNGVSRRLTVDGTAETTAFDVINNNNCDVASSSGAGISTPADAACGNDPSNAPSKGCSPLMNSQAENGLKSDDKVTRSAPAYQKEHTHGSDDQPVDPTSTAQQSSLGMEGSNDQNIASTKGKRKVTSQLVRKSLTDAGVLHPQITKQSISDNQKSLPQRKVILTKCSAPQKMNGQRSKSKHQRIVWSSPKSPKRPLVVRKHHQTSVSKQHIVLRPKPARVNPSETNHQPASTQQQKSTSNSQPIEIKQMSSTSKAHSSSGKKNFTEIKREPVTPEPAESVVKYSPRGKELRGAMNVDVASIFGKNVKLIENGPHKGFLQITRPDGKVVLCSVPTKFFTPSSGGSSPVGKSDVTAGPAFPSSVPSTHTDGLQALPSANTSTPVSPAATLAHPVNSSQNSSIPVPALKGQTHQFQRVTPRVSRDNCAPCRM